MKNEEIIQKKQALRLKRLQAEIDLLQIEINDKTKVPSRGDKLSSFFKKWSAVLITVISIFGGFWGIFYPIKSYFKEKNKELQFQLNQSMIKIVQDLSSADAYKKNSAVVLLSYYEENAIPILLYNLEKSGKVENDLIITISRIYDRKPTTTFEVLEGSSVDLFRKESEKVGESVNVIGLINYRRLLHKINFRKKHKAAIDSMTNKQDSILFNNLIYELIGATGDNIELFVTEISQLYKKPDVQLPIICSVVENTFRKESQKPASLIQEGIENYSKLFKFLKFRKLDTAMVNNTIQTSTRLLLEGKEDGSEDYDAAYYYCEFMFDAQKAINIIL